MCQSPLENASFYDQLTDLDYRAACDVQDRGCPHCGGVLDRADYPRKPRGVLRSLLGESYGSRFSFCCRHCRRRVTPPSARFLGRKVYLGVTVLLAIALRQGLSDSGSRRLVESLDIPWRTLNRWRIWWQEHLPATRCWQVLTTHLPSIDHAGLPWGLLSVLTGPDLPTRLRQMLTLIAPVTTASVQVI